MARTGSAKAKILLLGWEAKRVERSLSKLAGAVDGSEKARRSINGDKKDDLSCWVPHPRTGIYFPRGHERVMDDVPDGAATFSQTSWLRSIDGVDKPDPDLLPDHHDFHSSL